MAGLHTVSQTVCAELHVAHVIFVRIITITLTDPHFFLSVNTEPVSTNPVYMLHDCLFDTYQYVAYIKM